MAITNVIAKIVKQLPRMQGSAGKITLSKTQLQQIGDKQTKKIIQHLTKDAKDPVLDIAYKAKSNYAIAGMRLRDGKKVLGNGAVSITNPNSRQAVTKYRASINNGETLKANGFVDGGKVVDGKDVSMGFSRKNGTLSGNFAVGEANSHNLSFKENSLVDLAKSMEKDGFLKEYTNITRNWQRNLDRAMHEYGDAVTGTTTVLKPVGEKVVDKFAKTKIAKSALKRAKDFDLSKAKQKLTPELMEEIKKAATKKAVFNKQDALKKFKELARTDRVKMEEFRTELNKKGYQAFFNCKTGEPKIIKAKSLEDALSQI